MSLFELLLSISGKTRILICDILRAKFGLNDPLRLQNPKTYAAPIGALRCPEICAFTGFAREISSPISKVFSDRKVLLKHKNGR